MAKSSKESDPAGQTGKSEQQRPTLRGTAARTRKSAATRERIIQAASDLMLERGSTSFQMSEVSERCNMSKGALYYYFTDRNELIEVVFAEAIQHSVEVAEQIVAQTASAEEALHELCINFGNQLQTNSMLVLAATYEYSNSSGMVSFVRQNLEHAADLISQQMERAKQKGIIREDVNTKIAGGFMFGGFLMASLAVANSSESVDAEKASEMIYSLAIQGLKPR